MIPKRPDGLIDFRMRDLLSGIILNLSCNIEDESIVLSMINDGVL